MEVVVGCFVNLLNLGVMMAVNFNKIKMVKYFCLLLSLFIFCFKEGYATQGIDIVSVSTDGHYALTTDESEQAILWDLQAKKSQVVGKNVHVFSAYFIPNTHDYLWQDQDKIIHIQNIEGKKIDTFILPFFVFGQAMTSDQKYYLAGDIAEGLHLRENGQWQVLIPADTDDDTGQSLGNGSELMADKPYNISIDSAQKIFIESNFSVKLWNLTTGKLIRKYQGNIGKTFATLSPDGKYIVSGDEQPHGFVLDTTSGTAILKLWDIWYGTPTKQDQFGNNIAFDTTGLIDVPKDFTQKDGFQSSAILSLKFIDQTHYLRFTTYVPYAILYNITDPKPTKYFPLGTHPWPAVNYYARDQAIDTSWQAHVLVVGKEDSDGILVYQYDPQKQTLTKVWDGSSCWMFC